VPWFVVGYSDRVLELPPGLRRNRDGVGGDKGDEVGGELRVPRKYPKLVVGDYRYPGGS